MPALTQQKRFIEFTTHLGKDVLIATQVDGREPLGVPFDLTVEFTTHRDDLDLEELLGTAAHLKIKAVAGSMIKTSAKIHERDYHGYFSRLAFCGYQREGRAKFRATLVPWLWFLTRTSDCRIFQDLSVPQIIETLFREAGFVDFTSKLKHSYPPLEFCVQYQETDFAFISRLMEREGIYYYFTHQEDSHHLVLCDDMSCHKPLKSLESIRFIGGAAAHDKHGVITDWEYAREVKPGIYAHNDFNFFTPSPDPNLRLVSRSSAPRPQKPKPYEIYESYGGFATTKEGARYARLRMEELQATRHCASAQTDIQGIHPGHNFTLERHPLKSQNADYLITASTWSAREGNYGSGGDDDTDPFYHCQFECIPATCVFRPQRVTPQPKIEGPQTATICGPPGQEIYVDAHARVKVQFHWDRYGKSDASSSCWIRVSQPWAGGTFGGMAIPRIGHEVVVDFIEGDPDRPIIIGRVYNSTNMPHPSDAGRGPNPARASRDKVKEKKQAKQNPPDKA